MQSCPNSIVFEIAGKVEAKGRGRVGMVKMGNKTRATVFTPAHTRKYEAQIRHAAGEAMGEREPFDCPVAVTIWVFLAVPKDKQKKFERYGTDFKPDTKPDIDNYVKAALDAINTIIVTDDKLVCEMKAVKNFATRPRMRVMVRKLPSPEALAGLD
jgi:Holliday junction resolvase RusA-like endonuclease